MKIRTHVICAFRAMTLLELIGVVFVVAVLAAMLVPVNPRHSGPARKIKAKTEMADLANAIQSYDADYGRMPLVNLETNLDVTYGISPVDIQNFKPVGTRFNPANSDLIIVLADLDVGVNRGHNLNPRQIKYLNAKYSGDTNSSGVGVDYQYRDPWGNPYIISLDVNQDDLVCDGFYANPSLYTNHVPTPLINTNGVYSLRDKAMIWSRGPDGQADMNIPANSGVNKDNILSWE